MKAQQNWEWVKSTTNGSTNQLFGTESVTCTDNFGHIYIAGNFMTDSITFGAITLHIENNAFAEIFIVKYDLNGNILWAKSSGGEEEYVGSISADLSGNIYLSGIFMGDTAKFDTINIYTSYRPEDMFLAKYDSSGNALWAIAPNGIYQDGSGSIATDANNNVYMTGNYQNSIIFGTDTLNSINPYDDIFLFKFDPSGNVLWGKSFGGSLDDDGVTVCVDVYNNVYITGEFASDSISFGNFKLYNRYPTNNSYAPTDIYLTKLNSDGQVLWAKDFGGRQYERPGQVTTDAIGNIYLDGWYQSDTMYFDMLALININDDTIQKIFLVKCDSSGNALWAKTSELDLSNFNQDYPGNICIDNTGNIYLTGSFISPSISFSSYTLINHNNNDDSSDFFITKYDVSGNVLWANDYGGNGDELGNSMCMDSDGNIYLSGYFQSDSIEFGSLTLDNNINNNYQVFLAKLGTSTGIPELQKSSGVFLYPNPFTTTTTLTLQGIYHNPSLFIYNLLGQEVRSIPVGTNTQLTINRERLSAGMYFYKVIDDNKEVIGIGKMVVE